MYCSNATGLVEGVWQFISHSVLLHKLSCVIASPKIDMWFRSNLSLPNSSRPDRLSGHFTPTNKSQCNKDPYCLCYFFAFTWTIPAINSPETSTWSLQYVDDSKVFRFFFFYTKTINDTLSRMNKSKKLVLCKLKKICPFSVLKVAPSLQCYAPYRCHSRNFLIKFWQLLLTIKRTSQSEQENCQGGRCQL